MKSVLELLVPPTALDWIAVSLAFVVVCWCIREAVRSGRVGQVVKGRYGTWTRLKDEEDASDPF